MLDDLLTKPHTIRKAPTIEPRHAPESSKASTPEAGEAGVIDALIGKATERRENGDEG